MQKSRNILVMDGIAIILIILSHELNRYVGGGFPQISWLANISTQYFTGLGLSLFTFSSGFKLMLNHGKDISDRTFLDGYFVKRFIRLYRPYLGYTLLALAQLITAIAFVNLIWTPGQEVRNQLIGYVVRFNQPAVNVFLDFLVGLNPAAYHLWYLVALIAITGICFMILRYSNRLTLFILVIPLILINLVFSNNLVFYNDYEDIFQVPSGIMLYLPMFIAGAIAGHSLQNWKRGFKPLSITLTSIFMILILIIILLPGVFPSGQRIVVLGLLFPFPVLIFSSIVNKRPRVAWPFVKSGENSFIAYLFHWPIMVPFLNLFLLDYMHLYSIVTPFIIVTITIVFAHFTVRFMRRIRINFLIEQSAKSPS